jgi:hypothetical protein
VVDEWPSRADCPTSIVWFERCYLGALGLKVVGTVWNWRFSVGYPIELALILGLLLWFGVVYKRSSVCRWIIILANGVALLWLPIAMLFYGADLVTGVLSFAALALGIAATVQLLHRDTDRWLEKTPRASAAERESGK